MKAYKLIAYPQHTIQSVDYNFELTYGNQTWLMDHTGATMCGTSDAIMHGTNFGLLGLEVFKTKEDLSHYLQTKESLYQQLQETLDDL